MDRESSTVGFMREVARPAVPRLLLMLSSPFLRTIEKNQRHGPCRLTNQAVFGSNHFKDLSLDEFKTQYLTGYNPPRQEELDQIERQTIPNSGSWVRRTTLGRPLLQVLIV